MMAFLGIGSLLLAPIILFFSIFWLWMLVHAILNKGLGDVEKIVWVLVVFFLHFLGAVLYFFLGRPKGRGFA